MIENIQRILPVELRTLCHYVEDDVEEIRLRSGAPPYIVKKQKEYCLCNFAATIKSEHLEQVIRAACGGSSYSVQNSLQNGYLTLEGGHRLGICGETANEHGRIKSFRAISSVCIRIAGEKIGIGIPLVGSTLIVGPPGSGKTTLLRDCIRILSDEQGYRVGLVDERGEIAACRDGVPQFAIGKHTDVLSCTEKAEGAMVLLRTMNPQWIAVDEITCPDDCKALEKISYCGVHLLSTAHAESADDLRRRRIYRGLLENCYFRKIMLLSRDHSYRLEDAPSL